MHDPPLLKRLLIECRYKHSLSFYRKMDAIGEDFTDSFPNWLRSSLNLDLFNRVEHRRVHLAFERSFVEFDEPSKWDEHLACGRQLISKIARSLQISNFKRIGIRFWFSSSVDEAKSSIEDVTDLMAERFLVPHQSLPSSITECKLADMAYVVDLVSPDGHKTNLRLGPMRRQEWFEAMIHEQRSYETEGRTLAQHKDEWIPPSFVLTDIDCLASDIRPGDVASFLIQSHKRANEIASGVVEFIRGEP